MFDGTNYKGALYDRYDTKTPIDKSTLLSNLTVNDLTFYGIIDTHPREAVERAESKGGSLRSHRTRRTHRRRRH